MRLWTKLALATTVVGAIGLAIGIARSVPDRRPAAVDRAAQTAPANPDVARTALRASKRSPARAEPAETWPNPSTVIVPSYLVTQPRLADRVQPLLQRGTDIQLAAEGFRTAELFAAVAHASHDLDVPFVLLKHRVLSERLPLSKAIAVMRPDVDAGDYASRAMAAARADVFESKRMGS